MGLKNKIAVLAVVLLASGPLHCLETAKAVKKDVAETREAFIRRVESVRAEIRAKAEEIREKAEGLDKKARKATDRKIKALQKQEARLDARLEELKEAGEERWGRLKDGIDKAAENLKQAYRDIADSLK